MRAIGYQTPLSIGNPASLQDIDLPKPVPRGRDLLVEIRAVSVNPVDTKVRSSATPEAGQWRVLGWEHIGLTGDYLWGEIEQPRDDFRPLRLQSGF
ncbi:hypothetical protein NKW43_14760 [Gluconobacter albidus]|nr:hypothetical protein [Gluconobacter albidus]MCP1274928.1 hypothetical protein [Gluconobacter albidus]